VKDAVLERKRCKAFYQSHIMEGDVSISGIYHANCNIICQNEKLFLNGTAVKRVSITKQLIMIRTLGQLSAIAASNGPIFVCAVPDSPLKMPSKKRVLAPRHHHHLNKNFVAVDITSQDQGSGCDDDESPQTLKEKLAHLQKKLSNQANEIQTLLTKQQENDSNRLLLVLSEKYMAMTEQSHDHAMLLEQIKNHSATLLREKEEEMEMKLSQVVQENQLTLLREQQQTIEQNNCQLEIDDLKQKLSAQIEHNEKEKKNFLLQQEQLMHNSIFQKEIRKIEEHFTQRIDTIQQQLKESENNLEKERKLVEESSQREQLKECSIKQLQMEIETMQKKRHMDPTLSTLNKITPTAGKTLSSTTGKVPTTNTNDVCDGGSTTAAAIDKEEEPKLEKKLKKNIYCYDNQQQLQPTLLLLGDQPPSSRPQQQQLRRSERKIVIPTTTSKTLQ
jgi:hypothetical protein